ncbi:hypothetical protein AL073_17190 [Loktanella sp. 1ANDIMAR09]|nr:hypothetical protein AL073_17190 [Loktanella sp. 1ANDIMAR09]
MCLNAFRGFRRSRFIRWLCRMRPDRAISTLPIILAIPRSSPTTTKTSHNTPSTQQSRRSPSRPAALMIGAPRRALIISPA